MLKNMINNKWLKRLLFLILSVIPVLPFLITQRFQLDWDAWFHFSRVFELSENIKYGKFIPDVSYFTFNNQGYGVNFFYPYFMNYPVALLWLITGNPIISFLLMNIVFHFLGLNIASRAFNKLSNDHVSSVLFAILYIFGNPDFNIRLLNLGTYNQQIAYIFFPLAVVGIYKHIFSKRDVWHWEVISSVSLIILTHVLTAYLLVIYTVFLLVIALFYKRSIFTIKRLKNWIFSCLAILLSTAIFIVPLLEQKLSNDWLSVPAMNLGSNGVLSASADKVSLWNRLMRAFSYEDLMFLIFIIVAVYLIKIGYSKIQLYIGMAIIAVIILQSNLVPYYFLDRFAIIDMIQFLNRFDIYLYFFICLFLTFFYYQNKNIFLKKSFNYLLIILFTLFASQNFMQEKKIFTNEMSDFDKVSYFGTSENIKKGLSNSNFGYFDADAGKGYYRINGFMDYRTKQQIKRIPKEDGGFTVDSASYKIENQKSYAPIINFSPTYQVSTNDFIENAVYYDGNRTFGNYNQDKFKFVISNIPKKVSDIRSSITYLKGFKAEDDKGDIVYSYKDANGWLAFKPNNKTNKIIITYHKTVLHKLSIILSVITWLALTIFYLKSRSKY